MVIGVMLTVRRRVGERGEPLEWLDSLSMPGEISRKEAGGMKAGIPSMGGDREVKNGGISAEA
jgi:hypothetical protein